MWLIFKNLLCEFIHYSLFLECVPLLRYWVPHPFSCIATVPAMLHLLFVSFHSTSSFLSCFKLICYVKCYMVERSCQLCRMRLWLAAGKFGQGAWVGASEEALAQHNTAVVCINMTWLGVCFLWSFVFVFLVKLYWTQLSCKVLKLS